ncbi:MAG: hypothetical protein JNK05_03315 [Myxococcales bacterium]|nr:hypothetical protein [Myxococcales bacterium]
MNKRSCSVRTRFTREQRARTRVVCALSVAALALDAPAQRRDSTPSIVTFDGAQDGARSTVLVRFTGSDRAPQRLGEVTHAPGSARRGVVARVRGRWSAFVVVAERPPHAGTYDSALYRVDARGAARLVGGIANASTPIVTEAGDVVVERGVAGVTPTARGPLREDALEIAAVDSETGALRTALRRRGQLAFVGTALRGHEVLVYTVDGPSSALVSLDVATGATRPIIANLQGIARDFSYDRARDTVVFARGTAEGYELATVAASGASASATPVFRTQSEHLMPLSIGSGRVVLDSPDGRGLAVFDPRGAIRALSPLGSGIDRPRAVSGDWVAFEHRATRAATTAHGLHHCAHGTTVSTTIESGTDSVILGLIPAGESL